MVQITLMYYRSVLFAQRKMRIVLGSQGSCYRRGLQDWMGAGCTKQDRLQGQGGIGGAP